MDLADFDFELPESLIARFPPDERDGGRLLVLDRKTGQVDHRSFVDLPEVLEAHDLLVVNDSAVHHARVHGKKTPSGGAVELLFIEPVDGPRVWRVMARTSKRLKQGQRIELGSEQAVLKADEGEGFFVVDLSTEASAIFAAQGEVPLPPYLRREPVASDEERYQTIFARESGSVAAPTAGLHFTPRVFEALARRGVRRAEITLHVGPGTFLPVRADRIEDHRMWPERFEVSTQTADLINDARPKGRIVAVGTTVCRTLESVGRPVTPGPGRTELFIHPGHQFQNVDALITNFHLPRSTLLMLVSAFAGRETILEAYREAVAESYRFFSYGDAMVIL